MKDNWLSKYLDHFDENMRERLEERVAIMEESNESDDTIRFEVEEIIKGIRG